MSDSLGEAGLKFFGAMCASISHEIKNRMAIINEQAGLLEDIVQRAELGYDIDMERLMRLADSVKVQINLAGDIIHNMNTFAHSVDIIRQSSNLNELLPLTVALFQRMADRRNVRLETRLPDAAVTVNTSPFFLMNLLWPCLDRTLVTAENRRTVLLGYDKHAE